MDWRKTGMECLAAWAVAIATLLVAAPQDRAVPPADKAAADKAGADKASADKASKDKAPKKGEVHFRVRVKDAGPLLKVVKIEISGNEAACGALTERSKTVATDAKGEVTVEDLPACKLSIKINEALYIQLNQTLDLTHTNPSPVDLPLAPEK